MMKKRWYLILAVTVAVACLLAACALQKKPGAPERPAPEIVEPTEAEVLPENTAAIPTEEVESPTEEAEPETSVPETVAETEHTHDWTETIIAPNCTRQGYTERACSICGETERDRFAGPTSHVWSSWRTVTKATETAEGKAVRSCGLCKKTESRVLPVLAPPHTHAYAETVTAQPTCAKPGTRTYTCACGNRYTDSIPVLSHEYTSKTVPASCLVKGYDVFTCRTCGNSYKDNETPATGHSWGSWKTVSEATITSTGLKERACTGCGAKETKVIEKIPHTHSHTGKVTTPAKCEKDGVKTFACSCGDTYTEAIPATGHTWGSWKTTAEPTFTAAGTKQRTCSACKVVETEEIPQKEHSHSLVHIKTKPTCTQEGYTTHSCGLCGYTYVDSRVSASGHTWSQWTTVTPATDVATGLARRTCSVCAAEDTKTLPKDPNAHTHAYIGAERVEPGCTTDGYLKKVCSCGATTTETLPAAHNWEHRHEDEQGHYNVYIVCHCGWRCSAAGDYIASYAGHIDSLPADEKWTHSYYDKGEWVVDVPARDWEECTVCGATR